MKSPPTSSKLFTGDWKTVMILALPIFIAAMWYGISHHYKDIWLYALAMMLASWGVSGWAVRVVRKYQEWRINSRRGPEA